MKSAVWRGVQVLKTLTVKGATTPTLHTCERGDKSWHKKQTEPGGETNHAPATQRTTKEFLRQIGTGSSIDSTVGKSVGTQGGVHGYDNGRSLRFSHISLHRPLCGLHTRKLERERI